MKKILENKWCKIGMIIFGALIIFLIILVWYGSAHPTPAIKVKVGLIRLDTKLWQIENRAPQCASEMSCVWQAEGIIREFILSQDKEISIPILLENIKNRKEKFYVRNKIIDILSDKDYLNVSQEELYPDFFSIVKDRTDNSEVRAKVLTALKGYRTQELVDLEMETAGDTKESENLRSAAIRNLGEIKEKGAVDLLVELLSDGSHEITENSIDSLGLIGDKRVISYIEPFLGSESTMLSVSAEIAIERLQLK